MPWTAVLASARVVASVGRECPRPATIPSLLVCPPGGPDRSIDPPTHPSIHPSINHAGSICISPSAGRHTTDGLARHRIMYSNAPNVSTGRHTRAQPDRDARDATAPAAADPASIPHHQAKDAR